jgi:hypothetical protein
MEIILSAAQEYAQAHSSLPGSLSEEILAHTLATHPESHMISGPLQGTFLSMISRMIKPLKSEPLQVIARYVWPKGLLQMVCCTQLKKGEMMRKQQRVFFQKVNLHTRLSSILVMQWTKL